MLLFLVGVLSLAMASPAFADCPGGEPLRGSLTCSAVTEGAIALAEGSQLGGSCASSQCFGCDGLTQSGPEHVYAFTPQATGSVTARVLGQACNLDLYVLESSCDPFDACIASTSGPGVSDLALAFDVTAGETYYLVLEGAGVNAGCASGTYTLVFDVGTSGCHERCQNGLDDDQDGDVDCEDNDCADAPSCAALDAAIGVRGGMRLSASPNPARQGTRIRARIAGPARATLGVHDVSGRLVRLLAADARLDGDIDFEWDGRTDRGVPARPGVYFVRLMLEGSTTTIPVVRLP